MDIEKYTDEVKSLTKSKEYYKSIQFDIVAYKFEKAAEMMQELIDVISANQTKTTDEVC